MLGKCQDGRDSGSKRGGQSAGKSEEREDERKEWEWQRVNTGEGGRKRRLRVEKGEEKGEGGIPGGKEIVKSEEEREEGREAKAWEG